jgi:hypothetical protein
LVRVVRQRQPEQSVLVAVIHLSVCQSLPLAVAAGVKVVTLGLVEVQVVVQGLTVIQQLLLVLVRLGKATEVATVGMALSLLLPLAVVVALVL